MIKKLRKRFVLLAMLSMFIVLTLLIGGINIINYMNVIREADATLSELAENGGSFPIGELREGRGEMMPEGPAPEGPAPEGSAPEGSAPEPDGNDMPFVPRGENVFAARYFSVLFDGNGEVMETDTKSIFMVDEESAVDYAKEVISSGRTKGFSDNYRYLLTEEDGGKRVIFYDCGMSLDNFRTFRNTSLLISASGLLLVYVLIHMLSGMITRPAAESYEKQKRFITDAGHEIKTPLAIINADTDVLETITGEDNEWISDIKTQIKNLTELTDDLVFLSKMDEGNRSTVKEDLELTAIVREICEGFNSRAVSSGKDYSFSIDDNVILKAGRGETKRLVSILLDNAMKYSPDNGRVSAVLKKNDRAIVFEVRNEMINVLTDDDIRHLFDRFYRADASRNSETGGHGLGLSIAKTIAESLGGKITASPEGKDLIMKVTLPSGRSV